MVADVFQEKPQRNVVPRIAGLTRGGDQINYLCKIEFFVTWFGKRYTAQNLMAQKSNTPFFRRYVTKEEGDFTNGISYSMWYARKALNSRHEQIPQGIALEQDLLLLTFKYRIKLFFSSKNGIDFQNLNNHHFKSHQSKQNSCLKVLERIFLKHWPIRLPFSSLHTDSVLSSIPVYFVRKTFIFLSRCKSPYAETELSCGLFYHSE